MIYDGMNKSRGNILFFIVFSSVYGIRRYRRTVDLYIWVYWQFVTESVYALHDSTPLDTVGD